MVCCSRFVVLMGNVMQERIHVRLVESSKCQHVTRARRNQIVTAWICLSVLSSACVSTTFFYFRTSESCKNAVAATSDVDANLV
jgi:hypothetical protein